MGGSNKIENIEGRGSEYPKILGGQNTLKHRGHGCMMYAVVVVATEMWVITMQESWQNHCTTQANSIS